MKILFAGNKERGVRCLQALIDKRHEISAIILPVESTASPIEKAAASLKLPVLRTEDPNSPQFLESASKLMADLSVLAGYGKIVKEDFLGITKYGCVNLHAGKLPEYRGSSPMNWALINGEKEFGISVIQVDRGVDSGPVLSQKIFPILITDHFADLEAKANEAFPEMLVDVVEKIASKKMRPISQDSEQARYFPLRFPEDGFILWDQVNALKAHNLIRGLSHPAPGAFSFIGSKKVVFERSELTATDFRGEPGRIYQIRDKKYLVGTQDRCIWVSLQNDSGNLIKRYDSLSTVRGAVLANLVQKV